jgi:hypothetical protein
MTDFPSISGRRVIQIAAIPATSCDSVALRKTRQDALGASARLREDALPHVRLSGLRCL